MVHVTVHELDDRLTAQLAKYCLTSAVAGAAEETSEPSVEGGLLGIFLPVLPGTLIGMADDQFAA
jgi:hypothetical protein